MLIIDRLLSTKDKIEANGRDKDLVDYFAIGKQVVVVSDDFEAFSREKVYQIMMGCYKEEYAQALDGVKGAEITVWWDRAVDIIPAGGSKQGSCCRESAGALSYRPFRDRGIW